MFLVWCDQHWFEAMQQAHAYVAATEHSHTDSLTTYLQLLMFTMGNSNFKEATENFLESLMGVTPH